MEVCRYVYEQLHCPLVSLFANDERAISGGQFAIYYVFSLRQEARFFVLKALVGEKNPRFPSITQYIHAANLYEREIRDLYGLVPEGHPDPRGLIFHQNWPPDLYPLRKDFDNRSKPPQIRAETEFTQIQGSGVYEIPVGPVHAGIIEPGHFRFSVVGEPISQLRSSALLCA